MDLAQVGHAESRARELDLEASAGTPSSEPGAAFTIGYAAGVTRDPGRTRVPQQRIGSHTLRIFRTKSSGKFQGREGICQIALSSCSKVKQMADVLDAVFDCLRRQSRLALKCGALPRAT